MEKFQLGAIELPKMTIVCTAVAPAPSLCYNDLREKRTTSRGDRASVHKPKAKGGRFVK